MKRNITINQTQICNCDNCTQIGIIRNDEVYVMQTSSPKRKALRNLHAVCLSQNLI